MACSTGSASVEIERTLCPAETSQLNRQQRLRMLRSCPKDVSRLLAAPCTNKMPRLCIVDGCQGINNGYLFPRDKDVRMQWMAQLKGRTRHSPSTRSFICYAHFRQDDFSNWYQKALGFASKLVLKKDAVPSVFNSQADTGSAVSRGHC